MVFPFAFGLSIRVVISLLKLILRDHKNQQMFTALPLTVVQMMNSALGACSKTQETQRVPWSTSHLRTVEPCSPLTARMVSSTQRVKGAFLLLIFKI